MPPRLARLIARLPWRAPKRESAPLRLHNRRLYILPTRFGLVFLALLGGLFVGAANYSINLGYLFTFLLGSVGLVAMLHTQRNLNGLVLQGGPAAPVFAGDTALLRLHVSAPGSGPRPGLRLSRADGPQAFADLPPDGEGHLDLALPQPRRGYHRPGPLTLHSTWPLGLFHCWTAFDLDWGVLVYPRPAPDALPFPPLQGKGNRRGLPRAGDEEFAGLRPYHPGDSPRRIAWKTVARGLPPLTKQFSASQGRELWLNWEDAPERDPEARLSRLTRWVLDAEAAGLAWGLGLPDFRLPPGRGEAHLRRALEALARFGSPE